MLRTYEYHSQLKSYIKGFIEQKRTNGYSYEFEAYIYTKFDEYCIENNLSENDLSKEALNGWMALRSCESKGYCGQRISFVRQLLIYMNSLGIKTYIPRDFTDREKHVPHILSDDEIKAFFYEVDSNRPSACTPTCAAATVPVSFQRMAEEYKVLFRLIYCCGLRNAEACNLTRENIDLENRTLAIIHSKGDKDRLVYLHDDMARLLPKYMDNLKETFGCNSRWLFPGKDPMQHLPKTTVDSKFNDLWARTAFSDTCDKKPTVHCLRHTFVVKRMNLWMEQGINLNQMMPYLSKYLGHNGRSETFYYYHQVDSAFRIIRQKDTKSASIIPEVNADE